MSHCKPCTFEYSRGGGTGVAEAIGNWGFANEVASPGHELSRMQCLLERMEALREKPKCSPAPAKKSRPSYICGAERRPKRRSEHSSPKIYPLITYTSVVEKLPTSDKPVVRTDTFHPILGRSYFLQRSDKWYRLGPLCCPQPSCPAPYCPKTEESHCYTGHCM